MTDLPTIYCELNRLQNLMSDTRLIEARDKVDSAMLITWSLMGEAEKEALCRVLQMMVVYDEDELDGD